MSSKRIPEDPTAFWKILQHPRKLYILQQCTASEKILEDLTPSYNILEDPTASPRTASHCKPSDRTNSFSLIVHASYPQDFLDGTAPSQRCGLPMTLHRRGCEAEFIEQAEVKVEAEAAVGSTQVSPRDISIALRPGG